MPRTFTFASSFPFLSIFLFISFTGNAAAPLATGKVSAPCAYAGDPARPQQLRPAWLGRLDLESPWELLVAEKGLHPSLNDNRRRLPLRRLALKISIPPLMMIRRGRTTIGHELCCRHGCCRYNILHQPIF